MGWNLGWKVVLPMGWSRGSELAEDVWERVRKHIPEDQRKQVAGEIIDLFENEDADDFYDDMQIMQDAGRGGADE